MKITLLSLVLCLLCSLNMAAQGSDKGSNPEDTTIHQLSKKELRRRKVAKRNIHYNILGGPSYTPDFGALIGGSALVTFRMNPSDTLQKRSVLPMAVAVMFEGGLNLMVKPQLFFKNDKFRIFGKFTYKNTLENFYGIGYATNKHYERSDSTSEYRYSGFQINPWFLFRLGKSPFYSTLSIWIGGIVLVAMLKVTVSENGTTGLKHLKLHQIYLGRYLIFLILGLLQSTLICLGDLFYLGIQCKHPFLFLLAGWISSIVYVNIIYTLTVSFGDIGKAVSVVLLVMQVAGTGGTFPIEVAPRFFKAVYSLFPFTHSMAALREAVGGLYAMDYWIDLGKLCIFLVVFLIMGLVLRKPIIKVNEAFSEKLEETKIM